MSDSFAVHPKTLKLDSWSRMGFKENRREQREAVRSSSKQVEFQLSDRQFKS
jgi:hypothetical protein